MTLFEMRTPYASGREICVQNFGNAYQGKEIEKRMPHFKSTLTTKFIKRLSEIKCYSQTMHAFLSHTSACSVIVCVVLIETCWDRVPFFAYVTCIAPMILRTTRFLCVIYAEICVTATAVPSHLSPISPLPLIPPPNSPLPPHQRHSSLVVTPQVLAWCSLRDCAVRLVCPGSVQVSLQSGGVKLFQHVGRDEAPLDSETPRQGPPQSAQACLQKNALVRRVTVERRRRHLKAEDLGSNYPLLPGIGLTTSSNI